MFLPTRYLVYSVDVVKNHFKGRINLTFEAARHGHKITVCWDITQYTLVEKYERFGRTCFLYLQEDTRSSEVLAPVYQIIWRHIQQVRSSVNVSNLYSGCGLFESRTGHMLTEIFHDFTQTLQANTISLPEISPWQFPSTCFPFIIH
jgi:hypothetical protein